MAPRKAAPPRRRRSTGNGGRPKLVTEVTRNGQVIGALVWSKDRLEVVFVEGADLCSTYHAFSTLSTRYRSTRKGKT